MKKRPSVYFLAASIAGGLAGFHWPSYAWWLTLALFALGMTLLVRRPGIALLGFLVGLAGSVATMAAVTAWQFDKVASNLPHEHRIFEGRLSDLSRRIDGSQTGIFSVTRVIGSGLQNTSQAFRARVRFGGSAANLELANGYILRIWAQAKKLQPAMYSLDFDGAKYGLSHNFQAYMSVNKARHIEVVGKPSKYFPDFHKRASDFFMSHLTPRQAALLLALGIGDTSLFEPEQKQLYTNIGAEHLLAVSGMQVSLLGWLIFMSMIPLLVLILPRGSPHWSRPLAAIIAMVVIGLFVGLCGAPKSACRAALMTCILFLPLLARRRVDHFDALVISALILIWVDVTSLLDAGFWLSYAALVGIFAATHCLRNVAKKLKEYSRVAATALLLLASSLGAFMAVMPVLIGYFGTIAPLSIFSNIVLVPLAGLLQIPAIIGSAISVFLSSPWLLRASATIASLIEVMVDFIAQYLSLVVYVPEYWRWVIPLAMVAAISMFFLLPKKKWRLALIWLPLCLVPVYAAIPSSTDLKVSVLPVGQGDSTLFQLPGGFTMLVDAGGSYGANFDPGEDIVVPSLKAKGVKKLDVVAITHPDGDHILGAFAVLKHFPVGELWYGANQGHPLMAKLLDEARRREIPVKNAGELLGRHQIGNTNIEVLAPQMAGADYQGLSTNDASLVMRISQGRFAFLWSGDIESRGEDLLLSKGIDLVAQVLKAPHHGSKTSSQINFIKAVAPTHVIFTTGVDNRFNFPRAEIVNRYEEAGAKIWDTAKHGEVTFTLVNGSLVAQGYLPWRELKAS
jgi:competence protein ComEC